MENSITQQAEHLAALLTDRLGIRSGRGFEEKLAKAGRSLPRWARRDGQVVVSAITMESHPKLAQQMRKPAARRAARNLTKYLEGIDPVKRRMGRFLDFLALVSVIAIVIFAAVITILVWRGIL
ncbi:hypothetical protein EDD53_2047 [Pacificibacter maritimus]|uniref:Uncharacterized protein n=1 Tax=Pacificibacter maritimus TaxID=762213 RepID=A0A3N4UD29_9RHOB|nr:hypothetical protein [Pacificibacter maritimus]RPE66345.1 hypothetical protein EDD53_2047 [Pacificibacter maritimus]